jgi:hypothetical protein
VARATLLHSGLATAPTSTVRDRLTCLCVYQKNFAVNATADSVPQALRRRALRGVRWLHGARAAPGETERGKRCNLLNIASLTRTAT